MPQPEIRTERLLLRRWRAEDLDPYAAICADPEVMRWIGDGKTRTRQESAEAIERFERGWQHQGFGLFAAELNASSRCIGFVGLSVPDFLPEVMPAVEIGWRLARDTWGIGLATEGAQAALRYGFGEAGMDRLVSIIQVGNGTSERIALKLSMSLERETIEPRSGRRVRVYEARRQPP